MSNLVRHDYLIIKSSKVHKVQSPGRIPLIMLLDSLKEYHDKMNEIAEQKLQNIETNSKNEIDRVKLRAERDIQMLIEAEEVLAKPISGETLCVAMIPNSAGDESGSQEVTLYDRMKDFEIFLKNKQKQFDQLRNNWANLTGDLVRLIVEIVGTSSLGVEENQMPAGLITIFQEANAQHAEICQQYEEIISNLESFETRVADLADQSKNAMKKQQKELTAAKKKNIDALRKAMELFQTAQ